MTLKEAQEVLENWEIDYRRGFSSMSQKEQKAFKILIPLIHALLEAARVVEREKIRNSIDFYLKKEQENSFFSSTDNLEKLKQEILSDNQEGK